MDLRTKRGRAQRSAFIIMLLVVAIVATVLGIESSIRAIAQGNASAIVIVLLIACLLSTCFMVGILFGKLRKGE